MSYILSYTNYTIKDLLKKSGVYTITNKMTGKYYVGGARCFYTRFRLHIANLLDNKHFNKYLQYSVNKYGIGNFDFEILEEYPLSCTFEMETWWINQLRACDKNYGYNINSHSNSRLGAVVSKETREKMSKAHKGRKLSESAKKRYTESLRKSIGVPVVQLDLDGSFIREWECMHDITKELGIAGNNIKKSMLGIYKQSRGFIFVYKEQYDPNKLYIYNKKKKKIVLMCNLNNEILAKFEDAYQAASFIKGNVSGIRAVCTNTEYKDKKGGIHRNITYRGYKWKYEN